MGALFLAPHNDDEVLFGAFSILREKPDVVVVLRSMLQQLRGRDIVYSQREQETRDAMNVLGISSGCVGQMYGRGFTDDAPDWDYVRAALGELVPNYGHVYAPAPYESTGGHPHHDAIGKIALRLWGENHVTLYHTYQDGVGRVESPHAVPILDNDWIRRKLLALACYESQIREPSTGHHFAAALTEWYA
jgi:LmbE family N-acetylglucosaminyl deacetylase